MESKTAKKQLLDEIIQSVARKKSIVKTLPRELDDVCQILDMDKTEIRERIQQIDESGGRMLRTRTIPMAVPQQIIEKKHQREIALAKTTDSFARRFLIGVSHGIGILFGLSIFGALGLIIVSDLLGLPEVRQFAVSLKSSLRSIMF
ncbi:MAG: hypothetical protein WC838_00310 [Candidatus Margulisiibacteriota bacterium]|jgi:hypothetical protein